MDFLKKQDPKKLGIAAVAIVVVLAIIIGIASAAISSPAVKVLEAAKKTIFDAESLTFTIETSDSDFEVEGSYVLGKNVEDSMLYIEGGNIGMGVFENEFYSPGGNIDLDDYFDNIDEICDDDLDLDINSREIADEVINKGISEKALKKVYDKTLRPQIEEKLSDELETKITLPSYDDALKLVIDFAKDGLTEDALKIESAGKDTYKYEVDVYEFMACLLDYIQNDRSCKKYRDMVFKSSELDKSDFDDAIDEILEDFEDEDIEIKGEIKIEKGYISYFSCEIEDFEIEVTISNINKTEIDPEVFDDIEKKREEMYSF